MLHAKFHANFFGWPYPEWILIGPTTLLFKQPVGKMFLKEVSYAY